MCEIITDERWKMHGGREVYSDKIARRIIIINNRLARRRKQYEGKKIKSKTIFK